MPGRQLSFIWILVISLLILGLFAARVYNDSQLLQPTAPITEGPATTAPNLTISPQDPSLGSAQASLVLVELADFECPYCAEASPILEQFARNNSNQVRLVWKDFIISRHANSLVAAVAAQCAARQGKFWEYQRELFLNQTSFNSDLFLSLANSLGLNTNTFNDCFNNQSSLPLIEFNQQQIRALGLTETPTLFVNGQIFTGDITAAVLNSLLPQ